MNSLNALRLGNEAGHSVQSDTPRSDYSIYLTIDWGSAHDLFISLQIPHC